MNNVLLIGSLILSLVSVEAQARDKMRVRSVNGIAYRTGQHIQVQPGETISIEAGVANYTIDYTGNSHTAFYNEYDRSYLSPNQLRWSAGFNSFDQCDTWPVVSSSIYGCRSNFETYGAYDNYGQYRVFGVYYQVPFNQANSISRIRISADQRYFGGYFQYQKDSYVDVILENRYYNDRDFYSDNHDDNYYDDPNNYYQSLLRYGNWVYVNGTRVFVPFKQAYVNNWNDWAPYQHGSWGYADSYGYTWNSLDPWGRITDHYGYWRYHVSYGWIWAPFTGADFYYRPSVVTFYYGSTGVSWSPFWSGFNSGYVGGYNEGYRDGFWDGYNAGRSNPAYFYNGYHNDVYRSRGYNYGITYVTYNNFNTTNVYNVRVNDTNHVRTCMNEAVSNQRYGMVLGGTPNTRYSNNSNDRTNAVAQSRQFQQGNANVRVAPVAMQSVQNGGRSFVRPAPVAAAPEQYRQAQGGVSNATRNAQPAPISTGSRVTREATPANSGNGNAQPNGQRQAPSVRIERPTAPIVTPVNPGTSREQPAPNTNNGNRNNGGANTQPSQPAPQPREERREQPVQPQPREERREQPAQQPVQPQPREERRQQPAQQPVQPQPREERRQQPAQQPAQPQPREERRQQPAQQPAQPQPREERRQQPAQQPAQAQPRQAQPSPAGGAPRRGGR